MIDDEDEMSENLLDRPDGEEYAEEEEDTVEEWTD